MTTYDPQTTLDATSRNAVAYSRPYVGICVAARGWSFVILIDAKLRRTRDVVASAPGAALRYGLGVVGVKRISATSCA